MSRVKEYLRAVRRVSGELDVPGTPRTVRLDDVAPDGRGAVRLRWSFLDPEVRVGETASHGRRIKGELTFPAAGDPRKAARAWWAEAQLAAADAYRQQVDADWIPGEPHVRRVWSREEAWEALLTHLRSSWDEVVVDDEGVRAVRDREGDREEVLYRLDPDEWADHLTGPARTQASERSDVLPAAVPLQDGLPLWAVDELDEVAGAWGRAALVDGRFVRLRSPDADEDG